MTAKPAMTLRQIREALGHTVPPDGLEPVVRATAYSVSVLPEDFPDGDMWTLQLESRGGGLWAVRHRGAFLGADGAWSWGFSWPGGEPVGDVEIHDYNAGEDAWRASHRFLLEEALRLATVAAPLVTVMGRTPAVALAEGRPA